MSNKLELNLENFQSISDGSLIFQDGLNLIIGQSNSGKTATFRALKTCLLNPINSQRFIKKGTKSAEVTLIYNDNIITWRRTPKESSYVINGKEFVKTGKDNAMKMLENSTGFVLDEDNGYLMNMEEELQLPFPFGISKSELFKLFENVFCVSDSAVILKSAKEHEDQVKSKCSLIELDITKNKGKLEALQELKGEVDLDKLKNFLIILKSKRTRIESLKDGLDIIKKAVKVNEIDLSINDIVIDNKLIKYYELKNLNKIVIQVKQLHKLSKELPNYEIESKLNRYQELLNLKNTVTCLKEINKIKFPIVEFENKLQKYQELKNYKNELQEIQEKIAQREALKTVKESELETIQEKLKEFKVCPLCHSKLD